MQKRTTVWLGIGLVFCVNLAVLALQLFSHDNLVDGDGMFHMRMAALYRERGLFTTFPWMECSITREGWVDHQFLFHVLLIPFTFIGGVNAERWAGAFFGAVALTSVYAYLAAHAVRRAWIYSLVLLGAGDYFLFRMISPRAMPLALTLLVASIWLLERQRYRSLVVVTFFFTWAYQVAALVPLVACFFVLDRRRATKRWDLRPVLYATAGFALGMAINPFSPRTFEYLFFHIVPYFQNDILARTADAAMRGGAEWQPFPIATLAERCYPALVMGVVAPLALFRRRAEWPSDLLPLGLTTLLLVVLSLRSARSVEYAVPFAVLLGARIVAVVPPRARWESWLRGALLASFLGAGIHYHVTLYRNGFNLEHDRYRGAADWLAGHTPADSTVFHCAWGDFVQLFYFNVHNHYIYGLDPYFFYYWNPGLYLKYQSIVSGSDPDPVASIVDSFASHYVLLRPEDAALGKKLLRDPRVTRVYGDATTMVVKLP